MAKSKRLDDLDPDDTFPLSVIPKVKQVKGLRRVIEDYDSLLSTNAAIVKLIDWAIKEHWLPGYEKKPNNGLDKANKKGYKVSKQDEPTSEVAN